MAASQRGQSSIDAPAGGWPTIASAMTMPAGTARELLDTANDASDHSGPIVLTDPRQGDPAGTERHTLGA